MAIGRFSTASVTGTLPIKSRVLKITRRATVSAVGPNAATNGQSASKPPTPAVANAAVIKKFRLGTGWSFIEDYAFNNNSAICTALSAAPFRS